MTLEQSEVIETPQNIILARQFLAIARKKKYIETPPPGWRKDLIHLLRHTNFPPITCIEAVGFTQQRLDEFMEQTQDTALVNLINKAMRAFFHRKLQLPDLLDLKFPKFVELQLKCLTTLLDKEHSALALTEDQLKAIADARKTLIEELSEQDAQKSKEVQEIIDVDSHGEMLAIEEGESSTFEQEDSTVFEFSSTASSLTGDNIPRTKIPLEGIVKRFQEIEADKQVTDSLKKVKEGKINPLNPEFGISANPE